MSFIWKDKINGESDVLAEDINAIAHETIRLEKDKANDDLSNINDEVFKEKVEKSGFSVETVKNLRDGIGENSLEGCDTEENPAMALCDGGVALGEGAIAGCKGYYIQWIDFSKKQITLTTIAENRNQQIGNDHPFTIPYAVGDRFSIKNGSHYDLCGTISAINNNIVTYSESSLGFTNCQTDVTDPIEYTFRVPFKPDKGEIQVTNNGFAVNDGGKATYSNSFSGGKGNAHGAYSAQFGKDTFAAYCAFVAGKELYGEGQNSGTLGYKNTNKAFAGFISGNKNTLTPKAQAGFVSGGSNYGDALAVLIGGSGNGVYGDHGTGTGNNTKVTSKAFAGFTMGEGTIANTRAQLVRGKYNVEDTADKYADIIGNGTKTARKNIHTTDWNGLGWYAGGLKIGGTSQDDPNAKDVGAEIARLEALIQQLTSKLNALSV